MSQAQEKVFFFKKGDFVSGKHDAKLENKKTDLA